MNIWHKKMVAIAVVFLLAGGIIGFMIGGYTVLQSVMNLGSRFIDPQLIQDAVTQYETNIANCYPIQL